ncbi:MAG: MGH1-like glycoside hydrolase domain-containing protein [Candidatus Sumerlaeota bacterium]
MEYNGPILKMNDSSITDSFGTVHLEDLPDPEPKCDIRLENTTPLIKRLWKIALDDVEQNIVETQNGIYLGAGTHFGVTVYTRDISYSGILGVNDIYPEMMRRSLEMTRDVRLRLGFRAARQYAIDEIDAPWIEEDLSESEFKNKYDTNSYTRRTDDVVWLWAFEDLIDKTGPAEADWQYIHRVGSQCFETLYEPFFDPDDGLYRGQASFIDIAWEDGHSSGYPQGLNIADTVLLKASSTNCLYVKGLEVMARACRELARDDEAAEWRKRADDLRRAILDELLLDDGTLAYYKDRHGKLEERREALGAALAVLLDVVEGEQAKTMLGDYPITDAGVALIHMFYDDERFYHNNSAWPFVDTFFLWAWEKATGEDRTAENAALLGRTCAVDGSFHELVNYKTKEIAGSAHQLWSAAGFINVCRRRDLF